MTRCERVIAPLRPRDDNRQCEAHATTYVQLNGGQVPVCEECKRYFLGMSLEDPDLALTLERQRRPRA